MKKEIIIIGGGIIGLSCAYFLHKSGHQVTVIDQSKMDGGASYVNAGYLSPSHMIPLSAPGVMKQGIKWMLDKKSPLYIKPRLNADLIKWSWAFNKSCTSKHVARVIPVMREIAVMGRDLYDQIKQEEGFDFQLDKKGLFMLCQTEQTLHHEQELVEIAQKEGLVARSMSATEVQQMMPDTTLDIMGATYFECDHHTTPGAFMNELKTYLVNAGVVIRKEEKVLDVGVENNKITFVKTDKEQLKADEYILAAGSWTSMLSRKLNIHLLLQAGKGYRVETTTPTGIIYPSILAEAKIAITPMSGFTRFAGTMEIAGINHQINTDRVDAIAEGVQRYFPEVRVTAEEKAQAASGLRPVSPDGMPYIGKSAKCKNLTIATGHAMMGWSLGPSTGKLIQEVIDGIKPSMDMALFHPDRRF
ncbi:FAD-dependent oxidoreductase [uncultured Dokdonia sp.]|uniref:NAD(P)/FAD-dependent oxidoreductase n=1 Tax=uncultured Dokdonia sp. TaxID=575653 RepID=UPI0026356BF1|nr:FAD-dependent oxidoreductase [uncultured Dokdonia sp.]